PSPLFMNSKFCPFGRLTSKQKSLRILSFTTDLEGAEILVPLPFWRFGLGLAPLCQQKEVVTGNVALSRAIKQMITQSDWEIRPLDPRHLLAKGQSSQFCLDGRFLLLVLRCGKTIHKPGKMAPLLFL